LLQILSISPFPVDKLWFILLDYFDYKNAMIISTEAKVFPAIAIDEQMSFAKLRRKTYDLLI